MPRDAEMQDTPPLKFRTFASNDDLLAWQYDTPNIDIIAFQAVAVTADSPYIAVGGKEGTAPRTTIAVVIFYRETSNAL
jgi:hypothetical protein